MNETRLHFVMLIRHKHLARAASDYSHRNRVIRELNNPDDKKAIYKRVLCLWLGSNLLDVFQKDLFSEETRKLVVFGYYCFIILDKFISTTAHTSPEFDILRQCRKRLLNYLNIHHVLLTENPQKFFENFKNILEKMNVGIDLLIPNQQEFVRKVRDLCLNEINRFLTSNITDWNPLNDTKVKLNDASSASSLRELFQSDTCKMLANQVATLPTAYAFFQDIPTAESPLKINKLFIQAKDGTILDGLMIENTSQPSNVKILALIGHFQVEHNYFSNCLVRFQQMFGHDMVFINHRNYSMRSVRYAKTTEELAHDVVEFAEHFASRNNQVVLYGMCGGAAHVILAADILKKKNIHCKVILDRFFITYSSCLDIKTMMRAMYAELVNKFHNNKYKFIINLLYSSVVFSYLLLILTLGRRILLRFANADLDFRNIVRQLSENNILVLQAKSKKRIGESFPKFTDLFVHPKNDMRFALKDKRHQNRKTLKELNEQCERLRMLLRSKSDMVNVFIKLADHFKKCLELIDNEKLTTFGYTDKVVNLHAHRLFELTTRNNMPLKQFLTGFFSKPSEPCDQALASITACSYADIHSALNKLELYSSSKDDDNSEVAQELHLFLSTLKQNEVFICNMGNRLMTTGCGNFTKTLQDLLATELFVLIGARNPVNSHHLINS